MSEEPPAAVPPGWYPDPGGRRQWRVWTGTDWSTLTRPYGPATPTARRVTAKGSLSLITAIQRVVHYGVGALIAGLALLVSTLAHWPGSASPMPLGLAVAMANVALGLLIVGSVVYAAALRELEGYWSILAFIPGVNFAMVSGIITRRLGSRTFVAKTASDVVLLALFAWQFHAEPWLAVAPVLVVIDQLRWTAFFVDVLAGPSPTAPGSP